MDLSMEFLKPLATELHLISSQFPYGLLGNKFDQQFFWFTNNLQQTMQFNKKKYRIKKENLFLSYSSGVLAKKSHNFFFIIGVYKIELLKLNHTFSLIFKQIMALQTTSCFEYFDCLILLVFLNLYFTWVCGIVWPDIL